MGEKGDHGVDPQGSQWCLKQWPQTRCCQGHKHNSIGEKEDHGGDLQGSQLCPKQWPQTRGCRGHKHDSIGEKEEKEFSAVFCLSERDFNPSSYLEFAVMPLQFFSFSEDLNPFHSEKKSY